MPIEVTRDLEQQVEDEMRLNLPGGLNKMDLGRVPFAVCRAIVEHCNAWKEDEDCNELMDAEARIDDLEAEARNTADDMSSLEAELDSARDEIRALERQVRELESEIEDMHQTGGG